MRKEDDDHRSTFDLSTAAGRREVAAWLDQRGIVWMGTKLRKAPHSTRPKQKDDAPLAWSVHATNGWLREGRSLWIAHGGPICVCPSTVRTGKHGSAVADVDNGVLAENLAWLDEHVGSRPLLTYPRPDGAEKAHRWYACNVPRGMNGNMHNSGAVMGQWRGIGGSGETGGYVRLYDGELELLVSTLSSGSYGHPIGPDAVARTKKPTSQKQQPKPPSQRSQCPRGGGKRDWAAEIAALTKGRHPATVSIVSSAIVAGVAFGDEIEKEMFQAYKDIVPETHGDPAKHWSQIWTDQKRWADSLPAHDRRRPGPEPVDEGPVTDAEREDALLHIRKQTRLDRGQAGKHQGTLAKIVGRSGGKNGGWQVWRESLRQHCRTAGYNGAKWEEVWRSVEAGGWGGFPFATWTRRIARVGFGRGVSAADAETEASVAGYVAKQREKARAQREKERKLQDFIRGKRERREEAAANAGLPIMDAADVFEHNNKEAWDGVLEHLDIEVRDNLLTKHREFRYGVRGIDWSRLDSNHMSLIERDIETVASYRKRSGEKKYPEPLEFPGAKWRSMFDAHCALPENQFHPLLAYFDRIDAKEDRDAEQWLTALFPDARAADPLVRFVSGAIPLGAYWRTMEPGCVVEEMNILRGPMGCGKSTAVQHLFPEDCRTACFGNQLKFTGFDTEKWSEAVEGNTITECREMAGVSARNVNEITAFVGGGNDDRRLKHDPSFVSERPRRGIMVGTCNPYWQLPRIPNNRRFIIANLGTAQYGRGTMAAEDFMDLWRDRIWGHAKWLYEQGVSPSLPEHLVEAVTRISTTSGETDPMYGSMVTGFPVRDCRGGDKWQWKRICEYLLTPDETDPDPEVKEGARVKWSWRSVPVQERRALQSAFLNGGWECVTERPVRVPGKPRAGATEYWQKGAYEAVRLQEDAGDIARELVAVQAAGQLRIDRYELITAAVECPPVLKLSPGAVLTRYHPALEIAMAKVGARLVVEGEGTNRRHVVVMDPSPGTVQG